MDLLPTIYTFCQPMRTHDRTDRAFSQPCPELFVLTARIEIPFKILPQPLAGHLNWFTKTFFLEFHLEAIVFDGGIPT